MINQRRPPQIGYIQRRFSNWERSNRSVYHFIASTSLVMILICGPYIYITNENFRFFQSLSIDSSPSLVSHLEREQFWFNALAFILISFFLVSNAWFSIKLVRNIRGQVHAFDRHLKHLIRGEWFTSPLRVRENDDFKDLVEQYGYFYKSLQAMTKSEIQILEKMKLDPSQRENYILWKMLLQQKKSRLGYEEIASQNSQAAHSNASWKRVS